MNLSVLFAHPWIKKHCPSSSLTSSKLASSRMLKSSNLGAVGAKGAKGGEERRVRAERKLAPQQGRVKTIGKGVGPVGGAKKVIV